MAEDNNIEIWQGITRHQLSELIDEFIENEHRDSEIES